MQVHIFTHMYLHSDVYERSVHLTPAPPPSPSQFANASSRDERMQEVFKVLFNCVILAQTMIHQQLATGAGAVVAGVRGVTGVANSVSPIKRQTHVNGL